MSNFDPCGHPFDTAGCERCEIRFLEQEVVRLRAAAEKVLPVLRDLSKAVNNIGVQMGGLSSEPNSRKREDQVRAVFERYSIESPRILLALAALEEALK